MGELERICEELGIAIPDEFPLYSGVCESKGNDGGNRVNFIKGMYEIWKKRNGIIFPLEGFCFQTPNEIEVYDSFPEHRNIRRVYSIGIKKAGAGMRLSFPREIHVPHKRILWTGKGEYFTIKEKD